jgi:predicted permease
MSLPGPRRDRGVRAFRFWRRDIGAEVDDEIAFHVDARAEELMAAGASPPDARARAIAEFGDVDRARRTLRHLDEHHARTAARREVFSDLWQDIRVAARSLARAPGFVAVVTLTLALGIGLNSAVYSIVDAYLFRPLPVPYGKDLVILAQSDAALAAPHEMSYPNYMDFRRDTSLFSELAAFVNNQVNLSGAHGAQRIMIQEVTANFFATLGMRPAIGRLFQQGDDDGELAHPYVVLSHAFWESHFGADPSAIGDTIRINNHPVTIIGVTPAGFEGTDALLAVDAFTPVNQTWPSFGAALQDRGGSGFNVIGRLRPGLSLGAARAAVAAKMAALERAYPASNHDVTMHLVPETRARPNVAISQNVPIIAAAFMSLVLLVLIVASANVASLLLARTTARLREQAIRSALGASRWRLARHAAIECLLLALAGGAGALVLATVAVRTLAKLRIAADVPLRWRIAVDDRVIAFTLAIVVGTALLAAIAPILATRRTDLTDLLKAGARGISGGHQRLRGVLVVSQLAVCVTIVVCAALFARSAANASRIDPGFRTDHIMIATSQLGTQGYDSVRGAQFEREIERRVAGLPGVRSAALARYTPFGYNNDIEYVLPEAPTAQVPDNGIGAFNNIVTPSYFETMRIPIVEGRGFEERDNAAAPKVALVTRAMAKRIWPGQSALGKRFRVEKDGPIIEIVGVTGDIQYFSLGETPKPFLFRPYAQWYRSSFTLVLHTSVDPASLSGAVRSAVASLDPTLPVFDVRSFDEHIRSGRALLGTRLGAAFSEVFGVLALLLAAVGLYGLLSYAVAQRTREIGIRVALGAHTSTVLRLVVRQGLVMSVIGAAIGLAMTFGVTRLLSALLFGVAPHDPLILGGVVVILLAVGVVASMVPALRAARVDPLTALRAE